VESFDSNDIFEKYDPFVYEAWFDRQNLPDMLRRAAEWIPLHRELLNITYDDWINEHGWVPYYEFVLERFIIWSYHEAERKELSRLQKEHGNDDKEKP